MIIEDDKIKLRELEIDDAADMYEYTSNPNSSLFLTWQPHTSIKQDEEFIRKAVSDKNSYYYGIAVKETNKLIGCIHVYNINKQHKRAEISYIINPAFMGKGYASRAVRLMIDWLIKSGFYRVQALCIESHIKSENVMRRCGMVYEGTLRNYAVLSDNNLYNMKIYSTCKEQS